jgi:hypothetical protein
MTEEAPADVVTLSAAQRYSVLVTALNTTSSNFVFHATQNPDMYDVIPDDLVLSALDRSILVDSRHERARRHYLDRHLCC